MCPCHWAYMDPPSESGSWGRPGEDDLRQLRGCSWFGLVHSRTHHLAPGYPHQPRARGLPCLQSSLKRGSSKTQFQFKHPQLFLLSQDKILTCNGMHGLLSFPASPVHCSLLGSPPATPLGVFPGSLLPRPRWHLPPTPH